MIKPLDKRAHSQVVNSTKIVPDTSGHDGGLAVGFAKLPIAPVADEGVKITWLKERYYRVLKTVCANIMRRLIGLIAFLEAVDSRPHIGLHKLIARRLCGKAISLFQFFLKHQELILYRHLRSLGVNQYVEQLQRQLLGLGDVNFRGAENLLNIFDQAGSVCNPTGSRFKSRKGHS